MAEGGTKKFLYTGPKKRGSGFDTEEDHKQFSYSNSNYNNETQSNSSFNFEDVWSIKKNVNVSKQAQKPSNRDGWSMNVNRGFYSRHGGLNGEKQNEDAGANANAAGGKSWGQQKTYSYSYGTAGEQGRSSQASSEAGGSPYAKNSPRGGNQPGRFGVQNTASQNNKFNF